MREYMERARRAQQIYDQQHDVQLEIELTGEKMTYAQYLALARRQLDIRKDERMGQVYFNVLHEVRPDLANQVSGGELDPFHNTKGVPAFLAWLSEAW